MGYSRLESIFPRCFGVLWFTMARDGLGGGQLAKTMTDVESNHAHFHEFAERRRRMISNEPNQRFGRWVFVVIFRWKH